MMKPEGVPGEKRGNLVPGSQPVEDCRVTAFLAMKGESDASRRWPECPLLLRANDSMQRIAREGLKCIEEYKVTYRDME